MIYGFVRQSSGQVRIYSEEGEGTMVCLYLPRAEQAYQPLPRTTAVATELVTIVPAEDDAGQD